MSAREALAKPPVGATSIGVVGAGAIVSTMHLPVIMNLPCTTVAWLIDIDEKRAARAATAYAVPYIDCPSVPAQLPGCSLVFLGIPLAPRAPYIAEFAARGIPVVTEKPFALSLAQHVEFEALGRMNQLHCGYMRRSYATVRMLRHIVRNKWFGSLRRIEYAEGGPVSATGIESTEQDLHWRDGGGLLRQLGCHGLDALLWITGATSFIVRSCSICWDAGTDRDIVAAIELYDEHTENTPIEVEFHMSWLAWTANSMRFVFDQAELCADITPSDSVLVRDHDAGGKAAISALGWGALTSYQAFYLLWEQVVTSVRTQIASEFTATSSRNTTALIDALLELGER